MANTLKLPVGIENFEEIRKLGFYYIDKTRLIEQLLQGSIILKSILLWISTMMSSLDSLMMKL